MCNTRTNTHARTLELRRVTEAPRSTKICATLKLPQERASWRGVTPSHKGPPASLMLAPWSNRTATISGRPCSKMMAVWFIHILWSHLLKQGRVELACYHSDHGCWPHEGESSHSSPWGSQDGPGKDNIMESSPFLNKRRKQKQRECD